MGRRGFPEPGRGIWVVRQVVGVREVRGGPERHDIHRQLVRPWSWRPWAVTFIWMCSASEVSSSSVLRVTAGSNLSERELPGAPVVLSHHRAGMPFSTIMWFPWPSVATRPYQWTSWHLGYEKTEMNETEKPIRHQRYEYCCNLWTA